MKRIFCFLLASTLLFAACNNNKSKESVTVTSKDGKEQVTIDPTQMQDAAQDMQKIKDELGKLTPLSTDQLKALIPAQLMGVNHSDLDVSSAMGASIITAKYKINDSTDVKLSIVDCAGPGGVGLFVMQYMDIFDDVEASDDETTFKTIEFNGAKAFESCMKNHPEDCTFTYFSDNRFLISLEGDNVGIDALKEAALALKLK